MPIDHFIAATNSNKVVTNYLNSGSYEPAPSVSTISNAMDVGDPGNFVRILELFKNEFKTLKTSLSSYSFDDPTTLKAMKEVYSASGYILDPHGAVGYLGLKAFLKENKGFNGIYLETAHPVKFSETVEAAIDAIIPVPEQILNLLSKRKIKHHIKDYRDLKTFLLN